MHEASKTDAFYGAQAEGRITPVPPFIWPEARVLAGQRSYTQHPPFADLVADSDLVSAFLVGVRDGTTEWVDKWMQSGDTRTMIVVIALWPACPTRKEDLSRLLVLLGKYREGPRRLRIRVLPVRNHYDEHRDAQVTMIPPTVIQGHRQRDNWTIFCVGSSGNGGRDPWQVGTFNVVLRPDDSLRDLWRRWFQFVVESAAPLSEATAAIPLLVPPRGDLEATRLWREYEAVCSQRDENAPSPEVQPETGEVTPRPAPDGGPPKPWDGDSTKLDPLALELQEIYARGRLATVDATSRLKPFSIPVKATLLGQSTQRVVGTVTQKQSFSLQVFDVQDDKDLEKCRGIADLLELFSYQLSLSNRWIPEAAISLLEAAVEQRDQVGRGILKRILGGLSVEEYVNSRRERIRKDLDEMYRLLGQGDHVPEGRLDDVLQEVTKRLQVALKARIAPRVNYNRIAPPDLTPGAPDENWNQPLGMLLQSATLLRESLTDPFFPRRIPRGTITLEAYCLAMDVFKDVTLDHGKREEAHEELTQLKSIEESAVPSRLKCQRVWSVIRGRSDADVKPRL